MKKKNFQIQYMYIKNRKKEQKKILGKITLTCLVLPAKDIFLDSSFLDLRKKNAKLEIQNNNM